MLCVINISEGTDVDLLDRLAEAAGPSLLDRHADVHHNRSVWTLAGPGVFDAARSLTEAAVELVDLRSHRGVHPRTGVVDVVPWVHLVPHPGGRLVPGGRRLGPGRRVGPDPPSPLLVQGPIGAAVEARTAFASWVAGRLGLPAVCYGPAAPALVPPPHGAGSPGPGGDLPGAAVAAVPERSLPEVRRRLWRDLLPDAGGPQPHPTAGAVAVGARPALVAYNLWLLDADLGLARSVAAAIRGPVLRTLGLAVGDRVQVSCNLIDPWAVGPGAAHDAVAAHAPVAGAELVGLIPEAVLASEPADRWAELGLSASSTIEARLDEAGLDGGSAV